MLRNVCVCLFLCVVFHVECLLSLTCQLYLGRTNVNLIMEKVHSCYLANLTDIKGLWVKWEDNQAPQLLLVKLNCVSTCLLGF